MIKRKLKKYPTVYNFLSLTVFLIKRIFRYQEKFLIVKYKQQNTVFYTIPKTGNSSINFLFLKKNKSLESFETYFDIHSAKRKYISKNKNLKMDSLFKFTIVRNPFDRLVSCYKNKVLDENRFKFLFIKKNTPFNKFCKIIFRIPDFLSDVHFMSQSYILANKKVDYTGRFENLKKDFEPIRKKFKLDTLPHINKSQNKKNEWRDFYTLQTANLIYKRYKKDFDLWYPNAYDELITYIKKRDNIK